MRWTTHLSTFIVSGSRYALKYWVRFHVLPVEVFPVTFGLHIQVCFRLIGHISDAFAVYPMVFCALHGR